VEFEKYQDNQNLLWIFAKFVKCEYFVMMMTMMMMMMIIKNSKSGSTV